MAINGAWIPYIAVLFYSALGLTTINERSLEVNYYWRDYAGEIPIDAVPGGLNATGGVSYIGQALAGDYAFFGIVPTEINFGDTALNLPFRGGMRSDVGMKILCSASPSDFKWMNTTAVTFKPDMLDKNPVKGGYTMKTIDSDYTDILFVGRTQYNNRIVVGTIFNESRPDPHVPDFPDGFFPFYMCIGRELSEPYDHFQVLVYDP